LSTAVHNAFAEQVNRAVAAGVERPSKGPAHEAPGSPSFDKLGVFLYSPM
jgi:hypothetical protein